MQLTKVLRAIVWFYFLYKKENVQEWLEEHGLGDYWPKFESSGYTEPSDLKDLKNISKDNLKETFNIHKPGHFNRL